MDHILTIHQPFDKIIQNLTTLLQQRGLQAQVSFNACLSQDGGDGACPHHGQEPCPCRYVVLLVFDQDKVDYHTITVYSREDKAWLTLVGQAPRKGQDPEAHEMLEISLLSILLNLTQPIPVAG